MNKILVLVCSLFMSTVYAEKKTVCLNMIVKNEKDVIERCLKSVSGLIDYWVIVDTGSNDGTQEIIKNYFSKIGIPGELHERSWVNFGHNRNEALVLAKTQADYILFIDADEYLLFDEDFLYPQLVKDFYYFNVRHSGYKYVKTQLIRSTLDWKWHGVLHEHVSSSTARSSEILKGVQTVYTTEGNRSKDPTKFEKDIAVLEDAVKQEPENTRNVFYLAQSYRDAGKTEEALKWYTKRSKMGGWDQEVFWSLLECALILDRQNKPYEIVSNAYCQAYHYRPSRLEPLYYLANLHRRRGMYQLGYYFAVAAEKIPLSNDIHFLQEWMTQYGILMEKSLCAYWMGNYDEFEKINHQLLEKHDLPDDVRRTVEQNLQFVSVGKAI